MDIGTDNHGQDWDDWRQVGGGNVVSIVCCLYPTHLPLHRAMLWSVLWPMTSVHTKLFVSPITIVNVVL